MSFQRKIGTHASSVLILREHARGVRTDRGGGSSELHTVAERFVFHTRGS